MEQDSDFKWGLKVERGDPNLESYKSFTFRGVKYSLYDSVYIYRTGGLETDIGKIVKIYSRASEKKVKIVWFLRPAEVCHLLGDYVPFWKELFLASGKGIGVSNLNPLEAIVGKCNVVCTSNDRRNPQPSEEEIRRAKYVFSCTLDVEQKKILKNFPDDICGIRVEYYFNRQKIQNQTRIPTQRKRLSDQAGPSNVQSKFQMNKVMTSPVKNGEPSKQFPVVRESESRNVEEQLIKNGVPRSKEVLKMKESEIRMHSASRYLDRPSNAPSKFQLNKVMTSPVKNGEPSKQFLVVKESENRNVEEHLIKNGEPRSKEVLKMKESEIRVHPASRDLDRPSNAPSKSRLHKVVTYPVKNGEPSSKPVSTFKARKSTVDASLSHVSTPDAPLMKRMKTVDNRLSDTDKSGWFKFKPGHWEDRLRDAEANGTLVLLDNLESTYTSSDVEGLVRTALSEVVVAKMIPWCPFTDARYGKAFVVFKSSDAAESAVGALDRRCLMLADGRGTLREHDKPSKFFGHLMIDKHRRQSQREEMRNAVATSHFAQPNTVEYDMAMEWCLLQEKSDLWWQALYQDHEEQEEEMKKKWSWLLN